MCNKLLLFDKLQNKNYLKFIFDKNSLTDDELSYILFNDKNIKNFDIDIYAVKNNNNEITNYNFNINYYLYYLFCIKKIKYINDIKNNEESLKDFIYNKIKTIFKFYVNYFKIIIDKLDENIINSNKIIENKEKIIYSHVKNEKIKQI